MKRYMWYTVPIFLIVAIGLLIFIKNPGFRPLRPLSMVGQLVPPFNVPVVDSSDMLTDQQLKGRFTVLVFFASWCDFCHAQMPVLRKIPSHPSVDVIGINIKDDPHKLKKWLNKNPSPFKKIALDPLKDLTRSFHIKGIPETFLIDPEGKIIFHYQGTVTKDILKQSILSKLPLNTP